MSDLDLKPCPFCGGEAEMMGDLYPYVECSECHVNFSADHSYEFDFEDAAGKWNTRLQSEVERLRGRCGELEESLTELIQHYSETWDLPILQRAEAARDGSGNAWLLRKQAEAIDEVNRRLTTLSEEASSLMDSRLVSQYCASVAGEEAQRLRQQAAESESQQEENDD